MFFGSQCSLLLKRSSWQLTLRHIRALSGLTTTKKRSAATSAAIHVLEKRNTLCSGTRQTLLYRRAGAPPAPGIANRAAGIPTRQNIRSEMDNAVRPTSDERSDDRCVHAVTSRPCAVTVVPARCDTEDGRTSRHSRCWRATARRRSTTTLPTAPNVRTAGMTTWLT